MASIRLGYRPAGRRPALGAAATAPGVRELVARRSCHKGRDSVRPKRWTAIDTWSPRSPPVTAASRTGRGPSRLQLQPHRRVPARPVAAGAPALLEGPPGRDPHEATEAIETPRCGACRAWRALRLVPAVQRLLRRLAGNRSLPRGVPLQLWLLLASLAIRIELVPDFVPVLGYADDAIMVTAVLRSVVRRVGWSRSEVIGRAPGRARGRHAAVRPGRPAPTGLPSRDRLAITRDRGRRC
jgi:uncharacterized membrane protein YkvA (DUF1232 family)